MIRVGVAGAAGRMGRLLVAEILDAPDLALAAAAEAPGSPAVGQDAATLAGRPAAGAVVGDDLGALVAACEVVLDFSTPATTLALAERCAGAGCALVSGTTGLDGAARAALDAAAGRTAILWAPNMSAGINVLLGLVADAVRRLGPGYDVEIVETHHRAKRDAPSGTALRLAEAARDAAGGAALRCGREGEVGARPAGEIGLHAVRGGDVAGHHAVLLLGDGEALELHHRASSRRTFAAGAVRAVRWVAGRPPGRYDMRDVLG